FAGFTVKTMNRQPPAPVPASPAGGAGITAVKPCLTVGNVADPNGDSLSYFFELDSVPSFTGGSKITGSASAGGGVTAWVSPVSLAHGSTYYWQCRAYDGFVYSDWSRTAQFVVDTIAGDDQAPAVVSYSPVPGAIDVNQSGTVQLVFSTDMDQSSLNSAFGISPAVSGARAYAAGSRTFVFTPASALSPGTQYSVALNNACDTEGRSTGGISYSFVTAFDRTPPADVTGLSAVPSDRQVTLSWTSPQDSDFAGVRVMRKAGSAPTSISDGTEIFSGSAVWIIDGNLQNGTTYYYRVFAFDQSGNFASGADISATAVDNVPPSAPLDFRAAGGPGRISLTWGNPSDCTGVTVVRKKGSAPVSLSDGGVVYSGTGTSFTDTGISVGDMYYYAACATDASGNRSEFARDKAAAFTPVPGGSGLLCVFSGSVVGGLSGDAVFVKDGNGVTCGWCVVQTTGFYGPLTVYGDDPATGIDEGAFEGEELLFYLNGARVTGTEGTFFNAGLTRQYHLTGTGRRDLVLQILRGWNLISVNFSLDAPAISDALSPLAGGFDKVLCWYGPESGYRVYDPAYPQFATVSNIEPGYGYWLHLTASSAQLSLEGEPPGQKTFNLTRGWNMVGYTGEETASLEECLAQISGSFDKVLCWYGPESGYRVYDAGYAQFASLTTMEPGKAYWIRVTAAAAVLVIGD
ncbi:MAG: Ig-like domain-containing protein, partial [Candidatus Wallbacteria bacterium]|nr:Ig-like domain-containing protein [Candidatus Wallbacteria bacterium]